MTALNPAKKFLYRELKNFLNKKKNLKNIGVDAACENFKNARFFPVKKYFGIDIREQIIKKGLKQNKGAKYIGIKFDLTNKNIVGNNFADIVVCTNTLYQISNSKKRRVLDTLIDFVKNKGQILIQVNKNDSINPYIKLQLKKNFNIYYKKHYDNFISKNYSKFFEDRINKKIYKIYLFLNLIKFNFFLSLFEFLFQNFHKINDKIIYFGENKNKTLNKSKLKIQINKKNFVRIN